VFFEDGGLFGGDSFSVFCDESLEVADAVKRQQIFHFSHLQQQMLALFLLKAVLFSKFSSLCVENLHFTLQVVSSDTAN
jgi:hypothetical protein